jgi:hypothetical protein
MLMNQSDRQGDVILKSVRDIVQRTDQINDEAHLAQLLREELGNCHPGEVPFVHDPPTFQLPPVPPQDLEWLAQNPRKGKKLPPPEGFDPVPERPRGVDVLWLAPGGPVPIELKYAKRPDWDIYGYEVLRDIFRLERLRELEDGIVPVARFAVLVSTVSRWWTGRAGASEPQIVSPIKQAEHLVQYKQPSAWTRWGKQYAPFRLANEYEFRWTPIIPDRCHCLIVPVQPQRSAPED